jgi:hypothetical protein
VFSAIVLIGFCGVAAAQSTSTTNPGTPNTNPGLATSLISVTGLNTANSISGAVGNFALGGAGGVAGLDVKRFALTGNTGAAGAPAASPWNVWGAASRSDVGYSFAPLTSSGHVNVFLAGVDYTLDNNVVLGVAAAYDDTSINLYSSNGSLSGNGWTVSPYIGVPINKNLAFDATIGYGRTNLDTVVNGASGSDTNNRTVGALGLTYRTTIDAWTLTGRGALLSVHDKLGAYTLTNGTLVPDGTVNVTQARLLGQAGYTFGAFTPYLSVAFVYDINRPDQQPVNGLAAANDRAGWVPAIGVRFKADNSVYGSLQYSSEQGRSEVRNNQILFNLGIRF